MSSAEEQSRVRRNRAQKIARLAPPVSGALGIISLLIGTLPSNNDIVDFVFFATGTEPSSVGGILLAVAAGLYVAQNREIIQELFGLERSFYPFRFDASVGTGQTYDSARVERQLAELRAEVRDSLEKHTSRSNFLSKEERSVIIQAVQSDLQHSLTPELITSLSRNSSFQAAAEIRNNSLHRLSDQIVKLGRRANWNLGFGITFAGIGMVILYLTLFPEAGVLVEGKQLSLSEAAISYIPRLALVFVVELVAFFFLRLFSKALDEIRYFQNEITNVEAKQLALFAANHSGDAASISQVISHLSMTERNGVIEKTQTTVEIERERAEAQSNNNLLAALVALLRGSEKTPDSRAS